jgi:hypothetical protein
MKKIFGLLTIAVVFSTTVSYAQVSSVEFGKNRVQYQKFKWKFYQTDNFNTYFSQDGLALGKYAAQIAEKELPELEEFVEYGLQRRANMVVYNSFEEYRQSNIGIGIDWQNTGGVTKLVNNKMPVYFDGNHDNLRKQIRQGIAQILVQNVLFGDDLGEFAANQALLDLPKWLTDGYIEYAGENWSVTLDNDLKSALLSGKYNNFYQLAFDKPTLAGHAFWRYIAEKFGKSKVTYMLYLSRIYRNLNSASVRVTKKKFKEVLKDFMQTESQKYFKDISGRKLVPKGQLSITEDVTKKDYIRFNANPVARSYTYAVVEYKNGQYCVVLNENFVNRKVLLKVGHRSREDERNPNYPILAWDGKGTRLACIYTEEGKVKLFVYDVVNRIKTVKAQLLDQFTQVQDMKYMLDANTLILSAVKSGQTDIFVYKIDKGTVEQITNDVYDDLDAQFVTFPSKTGIIFSSNRPSGTAVSNDTTLPGNKYNIFLVDNWNKSEFKQISQLTQNKFGNARYPSPYNVNHFTFVSDENGIANRYAGFFRSERAGLDTLIFIGDEVLRNPQLKEVDSLLKEWGKEDIDSVGYVSITNDSTYTFPLTNYQASLLETRTAGDNSLVSEVIRQGDLKLLYRLKVDENLLRRRNVTAKPTDYMKKILTEDKIAGGRLAEQAADTTSAEKKDDFFQNEFANEKDSSKAGKVFDAVDLPNDQTLISKAKLYEYRPPKFFIDYAVSGFANNVFIINKYQPFTGSLPVQPANGSNLNGLIRMGTSDLMEDVKITGGFRIASNLRDNDVLFDFVNQRKRLDWGFTYYRSNQQVGFSDNNGIPIGNGKIFSSYYLAKLKYPLDDVRSIRATIGPRFDRQVLNASSIFTLEAPDSKQTFGQVGLEYVHDDVVNPTLNIWKGLRYKVFLDWFTQIDKVVSTEGKFLLNAGFDVRHYLPIYRNLIWAVRGAGDFSWGDQKVIYYLGGTDGWLAPKFNREPAPDPDNTYAYQSLAINLRGFKQNVANGNNNIVLNSEFRVPVFATFLNKPINNAFIRNFQLVQFFDLGTAWNGAYDKIERPGVIYSDPSVPIQIKKKAGGLGPFAGGYGFGARSTLLGYFIRFDAAWEMKGVFRGKPIYYFSLGLDF